MSQCDTCQTNLEDFTTSIGDRTFTIRRRICDNCYQPETTTETQQHLNQLAEQAGRYAAAIHQPATHPTIDEWLEDRRRCIYLHGPVGSGKTYLAWSAIGQLARNHPTLRIETWTAPLLFEALRPNHEDKGIFERCIYANVLLLDDLGAEKTSEWTQERLFAIVDARYTSLRSTIITSNLRPSELAERLGERLASRLAEWATPVLVDGPDRRRVG